MNTTFVLIVIALVLGMIIGAKFGRILLLLALIGVAAWLLANLPKIVEMVGKAQTIANVLGWGW